MISAVAFTALLASYQVSAFQPLPSNIHGFNRAVHGLAQPRPSTTSLLAFDTKQNVSEVIGSSITSSGNTEPLEMAYLQETLDQEKEMFAAFDVSSSSTEIVVAAAEQETAEVSPLEGLFWRGSVVLLCGLWASNFPIAKMIMAEPGVDSSLYAVTRFAVAALALAPGAIASTRRTGMDWETLKGAFICGSWVAFGYLGQTLGLLSTTASRSCVICSLHCVFVAIIAEWMRVNKAKETMMQSTQFDFKRLIPASIAVAGVAVVELQGAAGGPNVGDLLSFAQPIGFGLGYLMLEELMAKRPDTALAVSAIKLAVVALASFVMFELTPIIQNGGLDNWSFAVPDFGAILASPTALAGVLYTGLVTTALALWIESKAFVRVPATDASLILTTEPLFAAGLAAVTLGETFGLSDYAGASLIIAACVMATLMDDESRDEGCPPDADECEAPRSTFGGY
ncbi:membrane [Seminavis robusta]|uniref:Membrane n=1 Tax=Seminavis robusta TaxID=568900 RepID=A0A9N8DA77_9STRA|nr:membrane [Seminavis robusta]|eukprot:Sro56_g033050.1 membrane (454) ;mRNA; r:136024-137385